MPVVQWGNGNRLFYLINTQMNNLEEIVAEQAKEIKKLQAIVARMHNQLQLVERTARRAEGQNRNLTETVRILKNRIGDR